MQRRVDFLFRPPELMLFSLHLPTPAASAAFFLDIEMTDSNMLTHLTKQAEERGADFSTLRALVENRKRPRTNQKYRSQKSWAFN
jgi:hypothetical protein